MDTLCYLLFTMSQVLLISCGGVVVTDTGEAGADTGTALGKVPPPR
jgi:hypothetical protein